MWAIACVSVILKHCHQPQVSCAGPTTKTVFKAAAPALSVFDVVSIEALQIALAQAGWHVTSLCTAAWELVAAVESDKIIITFHYFQYKAASILHQ